MKIILCNHSKSKKNDDGSFSGLVKPSSSHVPLSKPLSNYRKALISVLNPNGIFIEDKALENALSDKTGVKFGDLLRDFGISEGDFDSLSRTTTENKYGDLHGLLVKKLLHLTEFFEYDEAHNGIKAGYQPSYQLAKWLVDSSYFWNLEERIDFIKRPHQGMDILASAREATANESRAVLSTFWSAYKTWARMRKKKLTDQRRQQAIDVVDVAVEIVKAFIMLIAKSKEDGYAIGKLRNYGWNGAGRATSDKILKLVGASARQSDDDYEG
ncbi:hypothetical protein COLO4_30297 [Corchorus olitorius]|uniref:Uncharacterized protein n=1 Tax=Corchorus olitorius TaxID=93759 RepID=A0A1R3H9A3_9ROSI|nr:hypothetical protein COLO4_30297 [Corchorus olitorius]